MRKNFLFSIILLSLFHVNCNDNSTNPESDTKSHIVIDFQGGFEQDQIQLSINDNVLFNDKLTTDPSLSFAYRYEKTLIKKENQLKISVNNTEAVLDTNLFINDSIFCGIIYDRLNQIILFSINDHIPIYKDYGLSDLSKLEMSLISLEGYASFFPVHPPDPIHVKVILLFRNLSQYQIIDRIDFNDGKMFKSSGEYVGDFDLWPWYDVNVYPLQPDTITIVKVQSNNLPFEAPCYEYFYVSFYIEDQYHNRMLVTTDSSYYDCDF